MTFAGGSEVVALVVNESDNVAVIFGDARAGETAWAIDQHGNQTAYVLRDDIPYGHKFAVRAIHKGEKVLKYGEALGVASSEIAIGEHVHVQNLESSRGRGDLG